MKNPVWLAAFPFLFSACFWKPKPPPAPDIFSGYKMLSNPRAGISIGAVWYQGRGPNGKGAAADNLDTVPGVSRFQISEEQRLSLAARVGAFIGLSGAQSRALNIDFSDLKVISVKDVFKLNVRSNDNVLLEGISAGRMTITHRSGLGVDLGGRFRAKGVPVEATLNGKDSSFVTIDASNLFLAYRVLTFVELERDYSTILTDGTSENMLVLTRGLDVSADARALTACLAEDPVAPCLLEAPIHMAVTDPNLTTISGETVTKHITVRIQPDRMKPYTISWFKETELETGTVFSARYVQFDIPNPWVTEIPRNGHGMETQVRFEPASRGRSTLLTYEMREMKAPKAPGW